MLRISRKNIRTWISVKIRNSTYGSYLPEVRGLQGSITLKPYHMNTLSKIAAGALLIFITACSKDDNDAPVVPQNNTPTSTYVTAKVDGASFSSFIMGVSAGSCVKTGTGADTAILIVGADQAANSVTVSLMGINATGTYTVNADSLSFLAYAPGSGGVAYSTAGCPSVSGTIVVTAIDATHVEGTFNFTAKDEESCDGAMKTVTEGHFRGNY